MRLQKKLKVVAAVGAVAGSGLLLNTLPASAAGAGTTPGGHSTITASSKPPTAPFCIASGLSNTITLYNYGTLQTGTGVPYVGPFTATFNFGLIYYGPDGVYTNPGCRTAIVPNPLVPVTASIVAGWTPAPTGTLPTPPPGVGTINSCTGLSGTYTRVTDAYVLKVSGPCTVNSAPGLLPSNFVFSGNQSACLADFGVDNCGGTLNETEFVGAYTQAP